MSEFFPKLAWETSNKNALIGNNRSLPVQELFGNRFYSDQTTMELMCEFLLVATSKKKYIKPGSEEEATISYSTMFPASGTLSQLERGQLEYEQESRVNLKLFSILLNSGNPNPFQGHKQQYESIIAHIIENITILPNRKVDNAQDVISILSNLFLGFQGIGANRDWCAQSFVPVTRELLAGETIWKATKAKRENLVVESADQMKSYFERTARNFYSHGGEVLYLQLISLMKQNKEAISTWLKSDPNLQKLNISSSETDPEYLLRQIEFGVNSLLDSRSPRMLGKLAEFIDNSGEDIGLTCTSKSGWIPENSWKNGYWFALDLVRIFQTEFDVVEWLKMLEMACVLQVLRTLMNNSADSLEAQPPLLAVLQPNCKDPKLKLISKSSLKHAQHLIYQAIEKNAQGASETEKRNMHTKYGDKIFLKLAKSMKFVIPPKGDGEHFTLTKSMLTFLVTAILKPGDKMTIESFLNEVKIRHSLVFDEAGFNEINQMLNSSQEVRIGSVLPWLPRMLKESGFFIELSDSLSLVVNSASKNQEDSSWV